MFPVNFGVHRCLLYIRLKPHIIHLTWDSENYPLDWMSLTLFIPYLPSITHMSLIANFWYLSNYIIPPSVYMILSYIINIYTLLICSGSQREAYSDKGLLPVLKTTAYWIYKNYAKLNVLLTSMGSHLLPISWVPLEH